MAKLYNDDTNQNPISTTYLFGTLFEAVLRQASSREMTQKSPSPSLGILDVVAYARGSPRNGAKTQKPLGQSPLFKSRRWILLSELPPQERS